MKKMKKLSKATDSTIENNMLPSYYVAIGASAGGLEAIESFFTNMPSNSGLAFIVIQHLSPDYKSLMVELLSKKTTMMVHRAEDNMQVLPDNVYLIPPKKNLNIFHGKLFLTEQDHSRGVNLPIDVFFKSLAEDQSDKSIGIILSGTGSDGTRGLRIIKEFGGMIMVQKEDSAKFDGMPRAAISTGLSDFIIPPEEMPAQLISFAKHPYATKTIRSETLLSDEEGLTRIFSILREKCKIDFTFYKPSTINRRIERRMAIIQTEDIKEYVTYLIQNPGEVISLYRELLIGVTSFFRDPEAFDILQKKYLQDVLNSSINREVRFWITACSTGEEAYSMAILARECMEEMNINADVKIFATDIDRDAIHFAATGIYPESITADLSPRLLSKYFFKKDDNYQISRNIREMVVFAQHNLIKDPPFTNISFLSCRNFLIYLQPVLQRKAFEFFNFSLNASGILFLGTSETTGDMSDYFEPLDTKYKIFRSKGISKPIIESSHLLSVTDTRSREIRNQYSSVRRNLKAMEDEKILDRFIQTVSGEFIPLSIIVNEQFEVLHTMGDPQHYFKIPSGKRTNDITKMAIKELSAPITTGIQKVYRQHKEVRFSNIRVHQNNMEVLIELRIFPLQQKKGQEELVAVVIGEIKKSETIDQQHYQSFDLSKEAEEHLRDLEQDLQFTRENLQATIEELETSNEELQATNEELLASNEELQSTNEELQSTNEELFTVNAEYQSKIIELTELYNDVENILRTSQISFLLLDENLEVRRFSPNIIKIFSLLNNDIGRPITHISHFFKQTDPIKIIREVQTYNQTIDLEVITTDDSTYLMKVEPYVIGPKTYSGIVMSFVDISETKKSANQLMLSEKRFQTLFETMELGVVYQDAEGKIISANPSAERILGLTVEQMQGKKSIDPYWQSVREDGSPFPGNEHPAMIALKTGEKVSNVKMGVYNPLINGITWINISAVPMFKESETKPYKVYATFDDITNEKNAEIELKNSEEQYRQLFNQIENGIALHEMIFDENNIPSDYKFLRVNPAFEAQTGLKSKDIIGKTILQIMPDIDKKWIERYGNVVITGKSVKINDFSIELKKHYEVIAFRPEKGKFAVIINDITENINDNKIISENNNMLNLAMDTANMAWWDLNLKSGNVIFNNRKTDMLGFNAEDFKHYMDFVNIVHPDDKDKAMQAMQDHIDGKCDKYDVDYRIKTSTGDYKWFRDAGKIVKSDENGKPVRVTGLVTDISEMKKNEEELLKVKSELKSE
jgi:two-component system CheB/CheR fusion protein